MTVVSFSKHVNMSLIATRTSACAFKRFLDFVVVLNPFTMGLPARGVCRGPWPPLDFEIVRKKGVFFNFEWKKQISQLLAPPWKKFWENPLLVPPGKYPSDAHVASTSVASPKI